VSDILVGVIIGAHGIRGEVKLKSFTDDPKAIATYGPLVSAKGETFEITRLKLQVEDFICTLKNISDRNKAETLKGTQLFITRAQLPKDELYLHDLIGVPVYNHDTHIGTVIGFENFGAGDLIDVKIEGREETVLIPNSKGFVLVASKEKVMVDLPLDYFETPTEPSPPRRRGSALNRDSRLRGNDGKGGAD
jgi:16S rRNA processing protein RimM